MEETIKVIGIENLDASLQKIIRRYPDKAGDCLREEARKTRKEIVRNAKAMTNTNSKSKRSLGKIGSYRVSQVQGYGVNQFVEISARSSHYHLVERGHAIKLPRTFSYKNPKTGKTLKFRSPYAGQTRGRVQGKFYLKKAKETEAERFPEFVDEMLDSLLREAGF